MNDTRTLDLTAIVGSLGHDQVQAAETAISRAIAGAALPDTRLIYETIPTRDSHVRQIYELPSDRLRHPPQLVHQETGYYALDGTFIACDEPGPIEGSTKACAGQHE